MKRQDQLPYRILFDAKGEVSFEITETGHWYVATIHMVESLEKEVEYESNWATITFEIAE